jgi:uncharacterized membrane protein YoaK (UPF0700 family)
LRPTPSASPGTPGVLPDAGWADRVIVITGLLFVATLLVIGIVRDGFKGVWNWFVAMIAFAVFLSAAAHTERYRRLYPHWTSAYRILAVVSVLVGMAFAALIVMSRPF